MSRLDKSQPHWYSRELKRANTIPRMLELLYLPGWDNPKQGGWIAVCAWQRFLGLKPSIDDLLELALCHKQHNVVSGNMSMWAAELLLTAIMHPSRLGRATDYLGHAQQSRVLGQIRFPDYSELQSMVEYFNWPGSRHVAEEAMHLWLKLVLQDEDGGEDFSGNLLRLVQSLQLVDSIALRRDWITGVLSLIRTLDDPYDLADAIQGLLSKEADLFHQAKAINYDD